MASTCTREKAFYHRVELALDEYDITVEGNIPERCHFTDEQIDMGLTFVGLDYLFEEDPKEKTRRELEQHFVQYYFK